MPHLSPVLASFAAFLLLAALPLHAQALPEVAPGVTRIDPPAGANGWGTALAVQGNLAVIGARMETVAGRAYAGAVYLYRHDGARWHREARLVASGDTAAHGNFGVSLALTCIDGVEVLAVGADAQSMGSQGTGTFARPGRVYLFRRESGAWQPDTVLAGERGSDWFGGSVSLDGPRLAVGQWRQSDTSGGHVYVYERGSDGRWQRTAKIEGPDDFNRFGYQVSISGDLLLTVTRANEHYDRQSLVVYRRGAGGAWEFEADLTDVTDSVASGLFQWPSRAWLIGQKVMTAVLVPQGDSPLEWREHVLVLARGAPGQWRIEADFEDEGVREMKLSTRKGTPFVGSYAVVGMVHTDSTTSPPRELGARLYRWTGDRWAVQAELPRAGVVSKYYPEVQAVGEDGRLAALQYFISTGHTVVLYDVSQLATTSDGEVRTGRVEVRAMPSPARDVVNLSFTLPQTGEARVEVIDALGRVVHARSVAAGETRVALDVSAWAPGLYVALLVSSRDQGSVTFVVQ